MSGKTRMQGRILRKSARKSPAREKKEHFLRADSSILPFPMLQGDDSSCPATNKDWKECSIKEKRQRQAENSQNSALSSSGRLESNLRTLV
jgi:hypothetical protein